MHIRSSGHYSQAEELRRQARAEEADVLSGAGLGSLAQEVAEHGHTRTELQSPASHAK